MLKDFHTKQTWQVAQFSQHKDGTFSVIKKQISIAQATLLAFYARLLSAVLFLFVSGRCTGVRVVFRRSMLSPSFCTRVVKVDLLFLFSSGFNPLQSSYRLHAQPSASGSSFSF